MRFVSRARRLSSRVYQWLPVPLQNGACSLYGYRESRIRFGSAFRRELDALLATEWLKEEEIVEFQETRLREMVAHAYAHVPYYRDVMKARRLTPDDVRTIADLEKLPVLDKEVVRANTQRFVATNHPRSRLIVRHTSGTTGKALTFYSTARSTALQWAVWWRHRMRFGLNVGDLHANFTGKMVVPAQQHRPPYWRWNRSQHQALLNMQHLTRDKAAPIVSFLERHPFVYWTGYPSVVHALVSAAREAGVTMHRGPRVVTMGAENVLDFQRRDIADFTGAVLTDQYGSTEGCGNASQCPHFKYHEDFEFGIMECLDPVRQPDGSIRGSVVCTGFSNTGFPLLRYRVGDVGVWEPPSFRCACGRSSRVLRSIEGRMDDYVVTPEGRRIMRFDYVFKETSRVKEAQVVQRVPESIEVRVVRRSGYDARDEQQIRDEIARWISPGLRVEFSYVPKIEREANGKFRAVRSMLNSSTSAISPG